MAGMRTLRDLFESELRDVYDAEKQNSQSVAENDQGCGDDDLRAPLEAHLKETRGHATRLEKAFRSLDLGPRGKHCAGMEGILTEGAELMGVRVSVGHPREHSARFATRSK